MLLRILSGGDVGLAVSILTRPESRMLRPRLFLWRAGTPSFNPHPARKPDATAELEEFEFLLLEFQSSPGPKAGCYKQKARFPLTPASFNPHPARKPDATSNAWIF